METAMKTVSCKGEAAFLNNTVCRFLFYTQDIHNDKEDFNILCLASGMTVIFSYSAYATKKNLKLFSTFMIYFL